MAKYRKKPIEVEAFQLGTDEFPEWVDDAIVSGVVRKINNALVITTLEGVMTANIGDYVIKEPFATSNRQYYPCKADIFEQTYEKIS